MAAASENKNAARVMAAMVLLDILDTWDPETDALVAEGNDDLECGKY